jgi:hypothetical protein
MDIFQNEAKIGYAHKRLHRLNQGYRMDESVFMRLNTMGMVQDVMIETSGKLNPDFTFNEFDFKMESSRFSFRLHGRIAGDQLRIRSGEKGTERVFMLNQNSRLYLVSGIIHAVHAAGLEPGSKYSFDIFDPATMGQESVLVSVVEQETIRVMGDEVEAAKVLVNFKGTNQVAWIAKNGDIIREKGILGIRMEKTDRTTALSGLTRDAGQDLTRLASVASNVIIDQPLKVTRLTAQVTGIDTEQLLLSGGRQSFDAPNLTVQRESLDQLPAELPPERLTTLEKIFLKPSPFIQSDDPAIQKLAGEIVGDAPAPPLVRAQKITRWIFQHIEKRPVLSVPNALSTLENREGDCNEHSVLLAALARAAGIPARVEVGLVYINGRFYYHAWNLLFLGRWITADGLFGQLPADATHIRLASGSKRQLDLMAVIGQVQLNILETITDPSS